MIKFEFDCGCGLSSIVKANVGLSNPELRRQLAEGWFSVFFSPSKMRKCRTCGRKTRHGFAREREAVQK